MIALTLELSLPPVSEYRKKSILIENVNRAIREQLVQKLGAGVVYQVFIEIEEVASCRKCGCTENHACGGGCWWVEADLCSSCVDEKPRKKR